MSRTKKYALFILGVVSALGIAWLVRKRRKETGGLSPFWRKVLIERHGAEKGQQLADAVIQQRDALLAETPMPEDQALRWHLKENILPGLALYRALLQEHTGNQQAALAEVDAAFRAKSMARSRALLAPLKLLHDPFRLFKVILPQIMTQFPAEGWDITYVENNDEKVAFNITRCYYLNTLTALGAPELTASFCKGDDTMAEFFPPAIRFVRLHTIGRGDTQCDFQYCRVENP